MNRISVPIEAFRLFDPTGKAKFESRRAMHNLAPTFAESMRQAKGGVELGKTNTIAVELSEATGALKPHATFTDLIRPRTKR